MTIVNPQYCIVAGGINIDIFGKSVAPLVQKDSNPGKISTCPGGVGHNIAANMSLLGLRVGMLTAIGDDYFSTAVISDCRKHGIDLSHALSLPGASTGCYLALAGPDGDMAIALNDMEIVDSITPEFIRSETDYMCKAQLLVFDGNLREDTMREIASCCTSPIFCDPVSVAKGWKVKSILNRIHTIKPNIMEAEMLTGEADPARAARALVELGVKRAFVSAGGDGIYACSADEGSAHADCVPSDLVNATGGGDAVMAALCRAYTENMDLETTCRFAMAAGSVAIESIETISPSMNYGAVLNKMK